MACGERVIGEGGFGHVLAVVEGAIDAERADVVAVGGELFFLQLADAAFWIENDHADIGHSMECAGDGAAGVARGGDENGGLRAVCGFGQVSDELGHETGAEILEGEGRAMKQLNEMYGVFQWCDDHWEIESFPANVVEVGVGDGGSEEGGEDVGCVFGEGAVGPVAPEARRQGG